MSTPNTTPLTYNSYVTQIGTMAVVNTVADSTTGIVSGVDPAFNVIIPQMLNYAELRIQRDLDLLNLVTSNTYALTAGSQQLQISINDFVTIQTITGSFGNGSITPILPPLLASTKEFIQNVYAYSIDTTTYGPPQYFALFGGDLSTGGDQFNNILLGPIPDKNYPVQITGTIRMPTLYEYSTNPSQAATSTTFISTYLPDMLIMASMIYISAYQRNFGRLSDDPSMAQSYESQYQVLLTGAVNEEYRKKFEASAWSSRSNSTAATPTR